MGELSRVVEQAAQALEEATGLERASVVGANKDGDHWKVTVELVEKRSIPRGMDVLGIYEVLIDTAANLVSFERIVLRRRQDTDGG